MDVAGDVGVVGRCAEAEDLGVEADGDVEVVVAGEKEDGVAVGAELVVLLRGVDAVDGGLRFGVWGGGREEEDVGAEVGGLRVGGSGGEEERENYDAAHHNSLVAESCSGFPHLPREDEMSGQSATVHFILSYANAPVVKFLRRS